MATDEEEKAQGPPKWKLVTGFDVMAYACGLKAGDRVRLRIPLEIRNHDGSLTEKAHPAGEVWSVLPGSAQDPGVVFLKQADGERHTWDDTEGIFSTFEIVKWGGNPRKTRVTWSIDAISANGRRNPLEELAHGVALGPPRSQEALIAPSS